MKKITVIRVGNDIHPASQEDIENIKKELDKVRDGGILVTHHAVHFDNVEIYEMDVKE